MSLSRLKMGLTAVDVLAALIGRGEIYKGYLMKRGQGLLASKVMGVASVASLR